MLCPTNETRLLPHKVGFALAVQRTVIFQPRTVKILVLDFFKKITQGTKLEIFKTGILTPFLGNPCGQPNPGHSCFFREG